MMNLLEKLCWHAKHSDLLLVAQIAFVGIELKIFSPKLLEVIVQRFAENIDKMRFKDMERICFVIAMFNYKSKATTRLLQRISQHLLTVEKYGYLDSVIRCVDYLHRCGMYEPKLIEWALDKKTISDAYSEKENTNRSELLRIDMYAGINFANEYKGPRLSDKDRATIAQKRIVDTKEDWSQLKQIEKMLKLTGRHCSVANILPHYTTPGEFTVWLISVSILFYRSISIRFQIFFWSSTPLRIKPSIFRRKFRSQESRFEPPN